MEVILLQKIANLGEIGDLVKVKPGYGRNFLLPGGKATLATPYNIAKFESRRAELEAKAAADFASAKQRAAVVFVTHDPVLASRADRVLTMTLGELVETTPGSA